MDPPLDDRHLDLTYPCVWNYMVFGQDEARMRTAVAAAAGELAHTMEPSRRSRTGKYVSVGVTVTVTTNEERLEIFRLLHEHPDIVYVL